MTDEQLNKMYDYLGEVNSMLRTVKVSLSDVRELSYLSDLNLIESLTDIKTFLIKTQDDVQDFISSMEYQKSKRSSSN